MSDGARDRPYHGEQRRFRAALTRTAIATGFSERLIEKDYYCSLLLKDLQVLFGQGLVFKGGTCLSKVHTEFLRLSEDLDFGISLGPQASRSERRRAVEPTKNHLVTIARRLPYFTVAVPLAGQNNSKQYNGAVTYRSAISGENEPIKVEVSLREEVLLPSELLPAKTLVIDPISEGAAVDAVVVRTLSLNEAYAEKARAALTRRDPAIRDFFDLDKALRMGILHHRAPEFLSLVSRKLALTDDPVDSSQNRLDILARQIETQLKPVLRSADMDEFSLDRAMAMLRELLALCHHP